MKTKLTLVSIWQRGNGHQTVLAHLPVDYKGSVNLTLDQYNDLMREFNITPHVTYSIG